MRKRNLAAVILLLSGCFAGTDADHRLETYLRARNHYVAGNLDAARSLLQSPRLRDYPTAQVLLGRTLFFQGDASAAADVLEAVLEDDPSYVDAAKWLSRAYLSVGRPEKARRVLIGALAVSSEDIELLVLMGQVFRELGDPERAIEYFTKASAFSPRLAEAHLGLAEIYRSAGFRDRAEEQFRRAEAISGAGP